MVGWYGLLMVLGVALGAWVIFRESPKAGIPSEKAMDLVFWAVLGGLVGARLLHVMVEWRVFYGLCFDPDMVLGNVTPCMDDSQCLMAQQCAGGMCHVKTDCFAALKVWQGGWAYLGGFIGGIVGAWGYAKAAHLAVWDAFALLVVGLPLGHAVGRVGCLVEGCCFGKPSTSWMSWNGRIPVQAFEALGNLLVFLAVFVAWRRSLHRHATTGERGNAGVFATYALAYGLLRFVLEVFRGDPDRGYLVRITSEGLSGLLGFSRFEPLFLSTSQAISLVMVLAGGAGLMWLRRHNNRD